MEKYFIKFDGGVNPKNKAEHEAHELASGIGDTLVNGADAISSLVKEFEIELSKINAANKRCSDIKTYTWENDHTTNISVGGNTNRSGVCYLRIYTVKNEI